MVYSLATFALYFLVSRLKATRFRNVERVESLSLEFNTWIQRVVRDKAITLYW